MRHNQSQDILSYLQLQLFEDWWSSGNIKHITSWPFNSRQSHEKKISAVHEEKINASQAELNH